MVQLWLYSQDGYCNNRSGVEERGCIEEVITVMMSTVQYSIRIARIKPLETVCGGGCKYE
jgi:hypothetical protein